VDSLPEGLPGEDWLRRLLELDHDKRSADLQTFDPRNLVQQINRGDLLAVRQLVKDHPEKVTFLFFIWLSAFVGFEHTLN